MSIPPPTPQSLISSKIVLIDNQTFSNSPSLLLKEEPTLQTNSLLTKDTSFLDLLNSDSPIIEKITQNFTKTLTDIISSIDNISSADKPPLTDISHPLITPKQLNLTSMDIYQSMDTPSPTDIIVQTLLGLRKVSDYESEGHDCNLTKGEEKSERILTFSGDAKGEIEGSTLVGDEKGERVI